MADEEDLEKREEEEFKLLSLDPARLSLDKSSRLEELTVRHHQRFTNRVLSYVEHSAAVVLLGVYILSASYFAYQGIRNYVTGPTESNIQMDRYADTSDPKTKNLDS